MHRGRRALNRGLWQAGPVTVQDISTWLKDQCGEYVFDIAGVFRRNSDHSIWPIKADGPDDLERILNSRGHLLPLPKEPAALANVLEVSVVDFVLARIHQTSGAEVRRGSERGYPDLEIAGPAFGGGFHAVDVKAARRDEKKPSRTQSRITLYTGNTYFKHPELHWPGTMRPFSEYMGHLDLIMIYTLNVESPARVEDLELIVQEPWRIASKDRSSTTREYIGAIMDIGDLRHGRGVFDSPEAFYRYWRAFPFKVSRQVQKQYERALAAKMKELDHLKAKYLAGQ